MCSSIWKNIVFLLIILLLPSVVGNAQTDPPVSLLLPGDFHGDNVQIPETTGWWALCADGSLQKTTLSLTAVHNACVDGADEKSGLRIAHSGCIDALALLSDAPFFAEDTLPVCDIDLQNGQATLLLGERQFSLTEQPFGENGYQLVFGDGTRKQVIYQTEWSEEGGWQLLWSGDLNGDGLPDLLLNATHKYSVQTVRLFLSGSSTDGILREVATFRTTSC